MTNLNPIHNSTEALYGIDLYLNLIREWVTSRSFTPHGLAKAAKFGPGTFADIYKTKWNPRKSSLLKLEYFMEAHDSKIYIKKTKDYDFHYKIFKSVDIYDPEAFNIYLEKVISWVSTRGFTPHGLAKAASFGPGTFADMYTPKWNPRVSTLRDLEDFMLRYDIRQFNNQKLRYYYNSAPSDYKTCLDIGIFCIKNLMYKTFRSSTVI